MIKINIDKFIEELKSRLTDVNIGSYVSDDCGEDYFDDVLNLSEIVDKSTDYCIKFNDENITYIELLNKLSSIETEWETSPFNGFNSFKKSVELLGNTVFEFSDLLKEYLGK